MSYLASSNSVLPPHADLRLVNVHPDDIERFLEAEDNIVQVVLTRRHAVMIALNGKYRFGRGTPASGTPDT